MAKTEVNVWSDGYEGRFLEWCGTSWQAFEFANFRHWFGPCEQPRLADLRALRAKFGISDLDVTDQRLIETPPELLEKMGKIVP